MNKHCPSCAQNTIPHGSPVVYCDSCFKAAIIDNPAVLNTIFSVYPPGKISFSNNCIMFVGDYSREFLDTSKVELRKKLDITDDYIVENNGYYIGSNNALDEYWNDAKGEGNHILLLRFYIRKSSTLDSET
ncbi:Hypothetical protein FSTVST1_196 [Faustovirus ST1]|nr:Hypothetical protein FSTVST1_196 [Faustovirus ST1]